MNKLRGILAGFLIIGCSSAQSATGVLTATVIATLTDDTNYGKCMVRVTPSPSTVLAGCGAGYVTLDCSADFGTKADAQRKLDASNLAFITNAQIRYYLDDTKTHNGYCYATRVDNF
jgi:hypothetical protein